MPSPTRGELVRWEAAWACGGEVIGLFQPALLDAPIAPSWPAAGTAAQVGGAIAYTAGGVTGISNVFKSGIAAGAAMG